MGFIEAYKRLEKLCGEILNDNRCISAYIDQMYNTPQGWYLASGWDEDLKRLKHYRRIRNKIVHDPGCSEENMCSQDDTQWLVSFYLRIMNQTDPLALYRQATQPKCTPGKNMRESYYQGGNNYPNKNNPDPLTWGIALLFAAVVVVAIWWLVK